MEVNKQHRSRTVPGTPQEEGAAEVGEAVTLPLRWALGSGGGKGKQNDMQPSPNPAFQHRKGALLGRMWGGGTPSLRCSESPLTVASLVTGLGKEAGR